MRYQKCLAMFLQWITTVNILIYVLAFFVILWRSLITLPISDMLTWVSKYLAVQPGLANFLRYLWEPHLEHHLVWIRLLTAADVHLFAAHGVTFVIVATLAQIGTTVIIGAECCKAGLIKGHTASFGRFIPMLTLSAPIAANCAIPIEAIYPITLFFEVAAVACFNMSDMALKKTGFRHVAAICLAVAASVANAAGLMTFPALLWCAWRGGASRLFCICTSLFAVTYLAIYMHGLSTDVVAADLGSSSVQFSLFALTQKALYGLAFLGLPVSARPSLLFAGECLGGLGLLVMCTLIGHRTLNNVSLSRLDRTGIGLLIIVVGTSLLAAAGRSDFAVNGAVPLRYTVLIMPMYVGIAFCFSESIGAFPKLHHRMPAYAASMSFFLAVQQLVIGYGKVVTQARWKALVVNYYSGQRTPAMVPLIYPNLEEADAIVRQMRKAGL